MKPAIKIDMSLAFVETFAFGVGIAMYVVHHKQYSIPLGFCYGVGFRTQTGSRFESYGRFTPDWARRNGVQEFINKKLFETYEVISTCSGTKLGTKFLKSSGYKYDSNIQTWYKRRSK